MMFKKHIPNLLTLANLSAGCLGLVSAFNGDLFTAAYLIWIAAIFDFFDGFAARLLKVSSPIGKELDSLADMVTFGVLPAVIVFNMLGGASGGFVNYLAFSIAIFSALRLAKFNIDERQTKTFYGIPTPANAFLISGLPFWQLKYPDLISNPLILGLSIIMALLLVAPIEMLALKFDNYSLKNNISRYLLILVSVVLIVFFKTLALPIIILFYIFLSVVRSVVKGNN